MQKSVSWLSILTSKYKLQHLLWQSELLSEFSSEAMASFPVPLLRPLGPFPVGRGSNAVQAMLNCLFISSTYITSVVRLLYNVWSTFFADLVFPSARRRLECSPSLGTNFACYENYLVTRF